MTKEMLGKKSHSSLLERVEELISLGTKVLRSEYTEDYMRCVDNALFQRWRAGSLSFLSFVFGEKHTHSHLFVTECKIARPNAVNVGLGVLEAAQTDLESGMIGQLDTLVAADIFTDFLEMATHLIENGYKDPAASLVGAVLEDGLRKIAVAKSVDVKSTDTLSALNHKLAQAKIYNRLTQRKIEVWNAVRNNADHGNFNEYKAADVKDMLGGTTSFLEEYLS